jgi:hypothetical protein
MPIQITQALPISWAFWNRYACEQELPRIEALRLILDDKDPARFEMERLFASGRSVRRLRAFLDQLEASHG